jgi:hypothetical protein
MKQIDKLEDSVDTDPIINNPLRSNRNFPYVNSIVDSEKTPSPIEMLHNNETSLTGRFPLAEYYLQLNTESKLGIHKSSKFGPEQPFVINDIGKSLVELDWNFRSEDRADKFLLSPQGIKFLDKQSDLMRTNAQKFRTDVKYQLTHNLKLVDENPRKYDTDSLKSNLLGIKKINILAHDSSLTLGFGVVQSIANQISETLIAKATTVKDKLERKLTGVGIEIAKKIGSKLLDAVDTKTGLVTQAKQLEKKVDAFNTVMGITGGDVSKITGMVLGDNKVFADVGKDLVNLIPYGSDEIRGRTYRDLDFIPFKFYDVHNKKSIVFRATVSAITDTFTPEYVEQRYIGRPDNVYVYLGTTREISFTFDIYPKSDEELLVLWEKMNYLAGLTYPSWAAATGGGQGMIAPFCKLTLGQMYDNTSGYISGLTYTVMDEGTWETTFAKLPKYIQASCTFVYIGDRLPSSTQKHYEAPWVPAEEYQTAVRGLLGGLSIGGVNVGEFVTQESSEIADDILNSVGL